MAHSSWLSPDRKWVLVSEMDEYKWLPCRVVPYDGSSPGYQIGPRTGGCISGAWSPDGKTIYLSANSGDGYHVWRQRFPGGAPEQLTFAPTEEEGLAISADGHWLLTSAGILQSTVWVHDARGDRQVSGEGFATLPGAGWGHHWGNSTFSPNGKKLYYLVGHHDPRIWIEGQLWVTDLETGQAAPALPGVEMSNFDLAPDGSRVVFQTAEKDGSHYVWVAWLDRRSPPKLLIPSEAVDPHFGPGGEIYLFVPEAGQRVMYRVGSDGIPIKTGPADENIIGFSPRGDWIIEQNFNPAMARPARGGAPIPVCDCALVWGPGSRFLYFRFRDTHGAGNSKTFAVALPPDKELPLLPPGGYRSPQDLKAIKVAAEVDSNAMGFFVPGPDPSVYAYERRTTSQWCSTTSAATTSMPSPWKRNE